MAKGVIKDKIEDPTEEETQNFITERKFLTPAVLVQSSVTLIAVGLAIIAPIVFLTIQTGIERERSYAEIYRHAVDQLGSLAPDSSSNIEIRLGGIYGLERVADSSEDLHWDIMETLAAYIRQNTVGNTEEKCNKEISVDTQAALTVIARRSDTHRKKEKEYDRSLDLEDTCLREANLNGAHLERADLRGSNLQRADLRGADMGGADFSEAHLEGADLRGAYLSFADFRGAHLENADLTAADLRGSDLTNALLWKADLAEANLENVKLENANLSYAKAASAKNLTQDQIDAAFGDAATTLPDNLVRPSHWSKKELNRGEALSEWRKWLKSRR